MVNVELEGLEVELHRAEDGKLVVSISGPGDEDLVGLGTPDIRVWVNEALIYSSGVVGDDLSGEEFHAANSIIRSPGDSPEG